MQLSWEDILETLYFTFSFLCLKSVCPCGILDKANQKYSMVFLVTHWSSEFVGRSWKIYILDAYNFYFLLASFLLFLSLYAV